MINNEFNVIGVAVSNFEDITNDKYKSHLLRIEVEKLGSTRGRSFELVVQVYGSNNAIDTKFNIIGHLIACNGYLDCYSTDKGSIVLKAVANKIYVLDDGKTILKAVAKELDCNEDDES